MLIDANANQVDGSFANSSKGIRYRLKAHRFSLWKRLVREMEVARLKPCSWGYFYLRTSTNQYELLTADNCCCGTCRDLGFYNYKEVRYHAVSCRVMSCRVVPCRAVPCRAVLRRAAPCCSASVSFMWFLCDISAALACLPLLTFKYVCLRCTSS